MLDENNENQTILSSNDKLIFDSGCTTSNSLFQDHISHKYYYSEFPFNDNNEIINDIEKKKDYVLNINDQIVFRNEVETIGVGFIRIPKIIFIYKENTFILLNNKLHVKLDSTTFPMMIPKPKPTYASRMITKVSSFGSPPRNIEEELPTRPYMGNVLLGLNIINQVEIETKYIRRDITVMNLKHPKIYEISNSTMRRYDGLKTYYEIYTMNVGFILYCKTIRQLDKDFNLLEIDCYNLNNFDFYVNSYQLLQTSNHGDILFELESYNNLNLFNLLPYTSKHETDMEIEKLEYSNNIDGFITNSFTSGGGIEIKLIKNCCPFIRTEFNGVIDEKCNIRDDLEIILSNVVDSIFIKTGN